MRKLFTLLTLILFSLTSRAQTGVYVPELADFDTAMMDLMNQYNVPGGQLAVTYQGRLVYNRGFGEADTVAHTLVQPNSIFRVASVSKPVTGVAVMKLYEDGLVQLDAKVFGTTGILNDTIYHNILDQRVNDITLRQLLHHEGGWNRDVSGDPMFNAYNIAVAMGVAPPADPVTVIRYVLENKMLDFAPGTDYNYSNLGYCIIGRVIEKITGQTYEDYVLNNILQPLGITDMRLGENLLSGQLPTEVNYYDFSGATLANSVYDNITMVPRPYGGFNVEAMDAHGGWVASAEDLCRLLCAVDKFPTRPDILTTATIDTMIVPSAHNANYGLGIAVNAFNNWWHLGSLPGTSAEIVRAGNQTLNWAILFNTRNANPSPMETAMDNLVWNVLPSITTWPTHNLFTGIEEFGRNQWLSVYPNPATENLHVSISNPEPGTVITILNMLGRELFSEAVGNSGSTITIDTKHLSAGVYFVQVSSGNKNAMKKFMVAE